MNSTKEILISDHEAHRIIVAEHGISGRSGMLKPFQPSTSPSMQEIKRARPLKGSQLSPPPAPQPLPPKPSRFKRLLGKSSEWFQDQVNNLDPRPTYKKALGAVAVKAESASMKVHEKTGNFFRTKGRKAMGALALAGVLAGGFGVAKAINDSPPERATAATELTSLGQETAVVNEVTDIERFNSWVADHPGHDVESTFDSLANASDAELKAVYEREVDLAMSGFYGPYDGELPLWLQAD